MKDVYFIIVLEAGNSKIKVLARLVSSVDFQGDSICCVFTCSLCVCWEREREEN